MDLLLEEAEQGPWICYELTPFAEHDTDAIEYRPDYIRPVWPRDHSSPAIVMSDAEVKRTISELCGLGGLIPTPTNRATWTEPTIEVRSPEPFAIICYESGLQAEDPIEWFQKVLDQCLHALDRLVRLFRWLQSCGLVNDHFVTFHVNSNNQVEAVQVPLDLITRLRTCILITLTNSGIMDQSNDADTLSAAIAEILHLVAASNNDSLGTRQKLASRCALAVQALCVTMLSFGQAHVGEINPFFLEHSLLQDQLLGTEYSEDFLNFRLISLTCAGDMTDSEVMAFENRFKADGRLDLFITPDDLLSLWGPGAFISSQLAKPEATQPTEWCSGIAIRNGVIYKPSADTSKLHWKAGTADDVCEGFAFELDMRAKVAIGAIFVKQNCLTESGPDNTILAKNISSDIRELGTHSAKWIPQERQIGLQGGKFLNATLNQTWIRSSSRTRKQKGVEQADLDFLDQPWGLLVSVCTGVAQRVALREVLAEVMLPITDGWMDKPIGWQTLMLTDGGLLEALKKPTFREWARKLERDLQHALRIFIDYILQKIRWTGVHDDGGLVLACPQFGNSGASMHVPLKDSRVFTWFLKDTDRCATFACLTNMCFIVDARFDNCQNIRCP